MDFTAKLVGLPRRTFLGVMRSLRTYVNGMYRIADDLELAYTLLVASVESLAQDFDGHPNDWASMDEHKRAAVDDSLAGTDPEVATRVRDAILHFEHVALARRYREFAIAHIKPEYFRTPASAVGSALARSDLKEALGLAYQSRSKYVHQLKRLPHSVTLGHSQGETAIEDRATHLTLQGLARLMRSVIVEFVSRQPVVDREPYDYGLERDGVIQVRLAAQYWVGRADGDIGSLGRDKLEGFLEQLTSCLTCEPDASITDLREVLSKATASIATLERRHRLPYLALFVAFNSYAPEGFKAPGSAALNALIHRELSEAGSEAMVIHTLLGQTAPWSVADHVSTMETYLRRRSAKNGLRFPRLIESAVLLDLAERHRVAENIEGCRATVSMAVENHPGHAGLLALEQRLCADAEIRWRETLLPHR